MQGWAGYKEHTKDDITLAIFEDARHKWYIWRPETNDPAIYFRRGQYVLFMLAPTWFSTYEEAKMEAELRGYKVFKPNMTIEVAPMEEP